jgi:lysophospholipase L1-like esterase
MMHPHVQQHAADVCQPASHLQKKLRTSDRTNAQVAKYAAAVKAVSAEQAVPVLNMFDLVNALPAADKAAWASDGLHPSPQGQAMVFEAVKGALESMAQFDDLRWAGCLLLQCMQQWYSSRLP